MFLENLCNDYLISLLPEDQSHNLFNSLVLAFNNLKVMIIISLANIHLFSPFLENKNLPILKLGLVLFF